MTWCLVGSDVDFLFNSCCWPTRLVAVVVVLIVIVVLLLALLSSSLPLPSMPLAYLLMVEVYSCRFTENKPAPGPSMSVLRCRNIHYVSATFDAALLYMRRGAGLIATRTRTRRTQSWTMVLSSFTPSSASIPRQGLQE